MKLTELRPLMKNADRAQLEKAFSECYKMLKKQQKEEADPVLLAVLQGREPAKTVREQRVNFPELENEIITFLDNAYAGNYFAPNRTIPKSQRSKWRFKVKTFIKDLDKIDVNDQNYMHGVKLLTDIYRLMCAACTVYYFSTEDAFASIGWEQSQLFDMVVRKNLARGYMGVEFSDLLELAVDKGLSRESLSIAQEMVLFSYLKTEEERKRAMAAAHKLIEKKKSEFIGCKVSDSRRFYIKESINELRGFLLMLAARENEMEAELENYFSNVDMLNREVALYCALERMRCLDDNENWIKVYEYGIKQKIVPRDFLQKEYEERKKRDN